MKRLAAPLLGLCALALVLGLAELVARGVADPPRYHNEPLQLDAELGFRGIPGHRSRPADAEQTLFSFVLNEEGFRGPPLPAEGSEGDEAGGGRRILFVGDSFLVGAGVPDEQLLSRRVEDALVAHGARVRSWNLSAADYGTGQELLLLDRYGERLRPDVVVLAVHPPNDLLNNDERLAFRSHRSPGDYLRPYLVPSVLPSGAAPDAPAWTIRHTHPLRALARRSALFAWLEHRLVRLGIARGWSWPHPGVHPEPPEDRIAAGRAPHAYQEIYRTHAEGDDWEHAWQRTLSLLRLFRARCDALDARLLVLVIPEIHQVRRIADDVRLDLLLRAHGAAPLDRSLDWNLPERRLRAFFEAEGIDSVLLLPRLRAAVGAGRDVYLRDRHLNAHGHGIAAAAVAAALVHGPLPPPDLSGEPVRLPRPAAAPELIEPGAPEQWRYRGDSWLPWQPSPEEGVQGALPLQGALVVVPVRGRELLVRGIAAARRYPLEIALEIVGGPVQRLTIEKPGPFVLRVALPVARLPRSDGYLALHLSADDPAEDAASTGVIVREIGFPFPAKPPG